MTIVANTYLTFSAIGNREDLADTIYNIDSVETPFQKAIDKVKAKATLHEWQTQSLAAAANNAQLQGDDVSFTAVTPTVRLTNRTQISRKEVAIAGTQEAVDKAGRESELVYQLMLKTKELRRDMEVVLTGNRAAVTGNSTTAPQLRPLSAWYATNDSRGSGGADGSSSAAATDSGTQRPLTEALLKGVLQLCWAAGGSPDMIMVGPFNKTVISGFAGNATRTLDASKGRLVAGIDVYEGDFGTQKVVASRFSRDRDCHVLDTSLWALATLRPMKTEDLAKTGDAEKAMVLTEYTLESRQEAGSGVVADLTTA
jgi:hypothetical protein